MPASQEKTHKDQRNTLKKLCQDLAKSTTCSVVVDLYVCEEGQICQLPPRQPLACLRYFFSLGK